MHKNSLVGTTLLLIVLALTTSFLSQANAITWSDNTIRFTTYQHYDGYPAITQTKDMKIWLLWSREILGNLTLYYRVSDNFGKTWSNEKNLTDEGTELDENPAIMQAENGTIWVAWAAYIPPPPPPIPPDFNLTATPQELIMPQGTSNQSNLTVTSINGFNETVRFTAIDVPENVTVSFNPAQVTPPANGRINSTLTVSVNPTAPTGRYTFSVLGKSAAIGHTINIYLDIKNAPDTLAATTSLVQAVTAPEELSSPSANYEIYYKTSHDNGATWSRNIRLTNSTGNDKHPTIVQFQNGTIMMIWQSGVSGNNDLWYKTTTDGISWSDSTQLTVNVASDTAPSAIRTKNGQIWVTWASDRLVAGNYTIYYKTFNGTSWSNDTLLPSAPSICTNIQPAIVQAVDGSILIFWSSDILYTLDIYYAASSDNGLSWSPKVSFVQGLYSDTSPSVVRLRDTKIWVTWFSDEANQPAGNWDIYYKTSLPGDITGPENPPGSGQYPPDGVVNVIDLSYAAYCYGTTKGDAHYDPAADITKDEIVDMRDVRIIAFYIDET